MPIYMKYEGIDGPLTGKYKGWIELESAQLGTHRSSTSPTGRGEDRDASVPSVSEIVVTKLTDSASTHLYREALWGSSKKVRIDFLKKDGDGAGAVLSPYLSIELENALISSYSASGHGQGGARPMESLSLNFTKISFNRLAGATDPQGAGANATWNRVAP